MQGFSSYHPLVNFIYFAFAIGFSCFLQHPYFLAVSLLCTVAYAALLCGMKSFLRTLAFTVPILLVGALTNPLWNHKGITILFYLPNGNPITAESLVYGFAASVMLLCVILCFSCYTRIMTDDKFIYLFGRILPSFSLILSMTLRFVPQFIKQFQTVQKTQKCIGRDMTQGTLMQKFRHAADVFSIMITWCFENAIDTADSMKARGYGLHGRTAFSLYTFTKRDAVFLFYLLLTGGFMLTGVWLGYTAFDYYPHPDLLHITPFTALLFIDYFLLFGLPLLAELLEVIKWKLSASNI